MSNYALDEVKAAWADREGVAILSIGEASELAQEHWVQPLLRATTRAASEQGIRQ